MNDNEFMLFDRLQKIRSVIGQYGEDNFYISFSGGKDSCVLSALIDEALPGNTIPRVYADTGIELNMIRKFVMQERERDGRIQIIKPSQPIRETLEKYGYPFKSKRHSKVLYQFQKRGYSHNNYSLIYARQNPPKTKHGGTYRNENLCPKKLLYQFAPGALPFNVSDKCCLYLKEKPLADWAKENGGKVSIVGITRAEGGRRDTAVCLAFDRKRLLSFHPLAPVSKEFEDWYIELRGVRICDIYKPPYNFERTGCKGCPFNPKLQRELNTMDKYFPAERKQCEIIWKPVYDEYRRIGYRLKDEGRQMDIFDFV